MKFVILAVGVGLLVISAGAVLNCIFFPPRCESKVVNNVTIACDSPLCFIGPALILGLIGAIIVTWGILRKDN